jgi:hypothetical protein
MPLGSIPMIPSAQITSSAAKSISALEISSAQEEKIAKVNEKKWQSLHSDGQYRPGVALTPSLHVRSPEEGYLSCLIKQQLSHAGFALRLRSTGASHLLARPVV